MRPRLVAIAVFAAAWATPEIASACSPVPEMVPLSIGMKPASPSAGAEVRLTGGAGGAGRAGGAAVRPVGGGGAAAAEAAGAQAGGRTGGAQAAAARGGLTDTRTVTVHGWNATPTGTVTVEPRSARVGVPVKVK